MIKENKVTLNYTISSDLKNEFYEVSDKLGINKSKLICNLIKKWIEENNGRINLTEHAK